MEPPEDEMRDSLRRMIDKLVELGYASDVLLKDTPQQQQTITVFWTPSGRFMQREIGKIFDEVKRGEGIRTLDVHILFSLFLKTNDGEDFTHRT